MYGTWLTMTMVLWLPSSLGLTSYPLLVWSVCTLTITMCSQVYPDYKRVEKSYVWQCLEGVQRVVTYGGNHPHLVPPVRTVG